MKKIIFAIAAAAIGIMAVASPSMAGSSASANVERCGVPVSTTVTTAKFTALQPKDTTGQFGNVWQHDYTVIVNSDNSFSGTGAVSDNGGSVAWTETITGKFNSTKTVVSFDTVPNAGATFKVTNAPMDNSTVVVESPWAANAIEFQISPPVVTTATTTTPGKECPKATKVAGTMWYDNDSYGLANFTFAGQDGGPSASDKGTAFYADKLGYYTATATDVVGIDSTSVKMTLKVTSSKHRDVPAGTTFTVTLHDAPNAPDYFVFEGVAKNFVAKAGNILVG